MAVLADLRSALDRLTRPPLAAAAATLMLVMLLTVAGSHLAGLRHPSSGRIDAGTGDFLAFWTGAALVHDGRGRSLYDAAAQRDVQNRVLGGASPDFQGYLNPPLLAIALSPLVPSGYLAAFFVFDLLCALALAIGLVATVKALPEVRAAPWGVWSLVAIVASFQPMLQTTVGGQNTPITFALLAALVLALRRESTTAAAVALGLLSYKPQYAIGLGVALLLAGNVRGVAAGAALGVAHWLLASWWCGLAWPLDLLAFMKVYQPLELARNAATHFSWVRTADHLLPSPFGAAAGAAGVVLVLVAWWRARELGRRGDPAWLALALTGTMLVSPHLQYYDAALLVLPVALLVDRDVARLGAVGLGRRVTLAAVYAGYPLWEAAPRLGIQPLFLALLWVAWWAAERCFGELQAAKRLSEAQAAT